MWVTSTITRVELHDTARGRVVADSSLRLVVRRFPTKADALRWTEPVATPRVVVVRWTRDHVTASTIKPCARHVVSRRNPRDDEREAFLGDISGDRCHTTW